MRGVRAASIYLAFCRAARLPEYGFIYREFAFFQDVASLVAVRPDPARHGTARPGPARENVFIMRSGQQLHVQGIVDEADARRRGENP